MKWFRIIMVGLCLELTLLGCTDIIVKVGKKDKASSQDVIPTTEVNPILTSYDLEYYLQNLDNLRNTSANNLMARIQQNWRRVFRREFRQVRDAIVMAGEKAHQYSDGIVREIDTEECTELEKADITSFDGLSEISNLLEGSFIAHLTSDQAQKINPDISPILEVSSNIILFELGMQANGWSEFESNDGLDKYTTKILWKVDPEVDDPIDEKVQDDVGVEIQLSRHSKNGKPVSAMLKVRAASGLFNHNIQGPVYKLAVEGSWSESLLGGSVFTNLIQVYKDNELTFSRQFLIEQVTKFSPIYQFKDTIFFGLKDQQSKEMFVDFSSLEKCAVEKTKVMVPGVIGMSLATADQTLASFGFVEELIEDRTLGAETAVVIAQNPMAGQLGPAGGVVQLILDFPPEDPFEKVVPPSADGIGNSVPND